MTLERRTLPSKLKPLILIPLLVLLIVFSLRACLEMVLVLKMSENNGALIQSPVYDRASSSVIIGDTHPPHPFQQQQPPHLSTRSSSPSLSSLQPPNSRERTHFGWNSGGRATSKTSHYYTVASFKNTYHPKDNSQTSEFSEGATPAATNMETFLTNVMVVSLL